MFVDTIKLQLIIWHKFWRINKSVFVGGSEVKERKYYFYKPIKGQNLLYIYKYGKVNTKKDLICQATFDKNT